MPAKPAEIEDGTEIGFVDPVHDKEELSPQVGTEEQSHQSSINSIVALALQFRPIWQAPAQKLWAPFRDSGGD
ncbi:hypothetical protein AJ88_15760 [Mesorhizobium amorphae CCBAU 01583]|nr:hypothetical protein AJ88_15760 [Mesorhizobium amorphae CCBAU 01583]